MRRKVLLLDDDEHGRLEPMLNLMAAGVPDYEVTAVSRADEAITTLRMNGQQFAAVSLDYDLRAAYRGVTKRAMVGTGTDVTRWLCSSAHACRASVVVHTSAREGELMSQMLMDAGFFVKFAKHGQVDEQAWFAEIWITAMVQALIIAEVADVPDLPEIMREYLAARSRRMEWDSAGQLGSALIRIRRLNRGDDIKVEKAEAAGLLKIAQEFRGWYEAMATPA